ncbi:MAG: hypothetical protein E7388_03345 [Ruminococcaceae bacterium]|nr:hypothetical protein [Oscillospiraceae bacterium]
MHEPDFYADISRIEKDKAGVLTSTATLFQLLAADTQSTKAINEGLGNLMADILRLGHNLGLAYEDMYLAMDRAVKNKFTA